jgi:hypothetical protein
MIRWYRLIKWVKRQRKQGYMSFNVTTNEDTLIIWNPENDEGFRLKY